MKTPHLLTLIAAALLCTASPHSLPAAEKSPADTQRIAAPQNQIQINARFIELPKGEFPGIPSGAAQASGVLTEAQAAETSHKLEGQKGVDILSSPLITIPFGHSGTIQVGRDYDLPPGSQPPKKFVGSSVEVASTAKGNTIDLDLTIQYVALKQASANASGKPEFAEKRTRVGVAIFDRSTVVVGLGSSEKEAREITSPHPAH